MRLAGLVQQDINTILAALRLYQAYLNGQVCWSDGVPAEQIIMFEEIATNSGEQEKMDAEDIDRLCELVNDAS